MSHQPITLGGCRPEPLGAYLKALGVFRLLAEQADPGATACWAPSGFVLDTALSLDELERFFLDRYRPTPILSPWNSSSGFGPEGAHELGVLESSTDDRLESYRRAIAVCRRLLERQESEGWTKEAMVRACRAELPEECVAWIDAAVVLTSRGPVYPPLLGSGGNDGRLEFSRNFHQRVLDVLGLTVVRRDKIEGWLEDSLAGTERRPALRGKSPGQFDGGAAGGPNSAPIGTAEALLNPWDWVLLMEGTLLFASGTARRLGAETPGRAAAPFTVEESAAGYASAAPGEESRGEIWLPIWEQPSALEEVRALMAEGRADWRRRHARTGLEFAEAAASLGVDRGITAFSRHSLLVRNGRSVLATPVGRVSVRDRPAVPLLAELDSWLDGVRKLTSGHVLPAGIVGSLRRVEQKMFVVAAGAAGARGGTPLLETLLAVADLELAVGRSSLRDRVSTLTPVGGAQPGQARGSTLHAGTWVPELFGGGAGSARELRLAVALASCHDSVGTYGNDAAVSEDGAVSDGSEAGPVRFGSSLRDLLCLRWEKAAVMNPPVLGLERRDVLDVLASAHARRVVELLATARRRGREQAPYESPGLPTRFGRSIAAPASDVSALAAGMVDERLLRDSLRACLLLDFRRSSFASLSSVLHESAARDGPSGAEMSVPPALAVLGPFYADQAPPTQLHRADSDPGDVHEEASSPWLRMLATSYLVPEAAWPALLDAGRAGPVLRGAVRRLRIAGLSPVASEARVARGLEADDARRLGAALLCPIGRRARLSLLSRACPAPPDWGSREKESRNVRT